MDQNHKFVEWLPLKQLWPLLIGVACQHTGKERLKVVGLLMEIINLQSKEGDEKKRLELSALKPLWQLYTTITKEYGISREEEERKRGEEEGEEKEEGGGGRGRGRRGFVGRV